MDLHFFEYNEKEIFSYIAIVTRMGDGYLFSRKENETGWHIPGGMKKETETLREAAERILLEESGATAFCLEPLCAFTQEAKAGKGVLLLADIIKSEKCSNDTLLFHTLPIRLEDAEIMNALFDKADAVITFRKRYGANHLSLVRSGI